MSTNNDLSKKKKLMSPFSNLIGGSEKYVNSSPGTVRPSGNASSNIIVASVENDMRPPAENKITENQKSVDGKTEDRFPKQQGKPPAQLEPQWGHKSNSQKLHTDNSRNINSGDAPPVREQKLSTGKISQLSRLLDFLIEKEILSQEDAERAHSIHAASLDKRRIVDILTTDINADEDTILKAVAHFYSFETVDPTPAFGNKERLQYMKQVLSSMSSRYYEMAIRRKIIPYELYKNGHEKLVIITPDITHPDVHVVARAFHFQKYEVKHVTLEHWSELWRQLAFDQGAAQLGMGDSDEFSQINQDEYDAELERSIEDEMGRGKLNDVVESILIDAVRTGASDLHVIPKATHRTEFHFRLDGRLSLWSAITDVRAEAIISVIKDCGKNLDRFEKFLSQDGFAQRTVDNKVVRFRFSTMPIYSSDIRSKVESVVIRVLRGAETTNGIESLGMDPHSFEVFNKAIRKPQGMVIFTGPTGSGKTTSQVAAIKTIMDPGINIITIEDPVEYLIEGCRQVKLNHKLDFEGALRGLLRHDPDVVMVGEMRDRITADIAVKLANTGHLIFSTLHTNDSVSAVTRLYNMGIEPFLLAYTINIVIAQRLVRKLCERCKQVDDNVDMEALSECGISPDEIKGIKLYKPVGCVQCVKGYRGRAGIFEVLYMNKEMRQIILKSKDFIDEDALRNAALQNGMKTLRQCAISLLKEGVTAIDNVLGIAIED